MSREAKADSDLSGGRKGSMRFLRSTGEAGRGGASDPPRKSAWNETAGTFQFCPRKRRRIDRTARRGDDPGKGDIRWSIFS